MNVNEHTFLVVGTGISGIAATELLLKKGAKVYLYDGNTSLDVDKIFEAHQEIRNVEILLGEVPAEVMDQITIAVLSPGVPTDSPLVNSLVERGILIWGEIELAYVCGKGEVVAITGTNGKTTTTSLVGHIAKLYFDHVSVVGNIGIPYTAVAADLDDDSIVVAEVSSFQLETIQSFAPKVSAILNITPDHLNRHHTMANYIKAKEAVTRNQSEADVVVLNYEDDVLRKFGASCIPHVIFFSSKRDLEEGLFLKDGVIVWKTNGLSEDILAVDELKILGTHNYENAMAAIAMCASIGVPMETIREGLCTFTAVEHRIEYVCTKSGIDFYNDSKGTNPDAAIKGIQAMNRRTVLIGGGYDKESTYDEWILSFDGKVKKLLLLGETKEKIAACCDAHGFCDYTFVDSLEEAVTLAYEIAEDGEAILLSPACASWDMFKNYEQRGDLFKAYAKALEE